MPRSRITSGKSSISIFAALLAPALLVPACVSADDTPATEADEGGDWTPTVGITTFDQVIQPGLATTVGIDQGIFEEEGLAGVEIEAFTGGADVVHALVNGEVDFVVGSPTAFIAGAAQDADVRIIAATWARPSFSFITRPDSDIDSAEDLSGTTIGSMQRTGLTDVFTKTVLSAAGIDHENDVEIVNTGSVGDMINLLLEGEVDIHGLASPPVEGLVADGRSRVAFRGSDYLPEWIDMTVTTRPDVLEEHGDDVRSFLRSIQRANDSAREDPQAAVDSWHSITEAEVSDEALSLLVETLREADPEAYDVTISAERLAVIHDSMLEQGMIEESVDLTELVDASFLP